MTDNYHTLRGLMNNMLAIFESVSLGFIDTSIFSILELLVVPIITVYYIFTNKNKSLFFLLFLVSYSIADLLHIVDGDNMSNAFYSLCNGLYVVAYLFLLFEIFKTLNFKLLIKKFLAQSIVLLALVVYLFIVLCGIIDPISFDTKVMNWVRFTEHSYNLVLLILLAVSFLNYLENDTKKSLLLFLGCLAISFSEFLLIGYYYLADIEFLSYIASALNISAFVLFFLQSDLELDSKKKSNVFA